MRLNSLLRDEWIIPRYRKYLKESRADGSHAEANHARDILARPQRDRSKGWSASSAGYCLRSQYLKSLGYREEFPDKLLAIFQMGHYVHLKHQVAGLVAGYLESVEVSVSIPEMNVLGTMDGVTTEQEIAEYKSISPYGYNTIEQFGPEYKHLRQVNAYMQASGLKSARIIYENKGNQDMREYRVTPDLAMVERNIEDWKILNDALASEADPRDVPCRDGEGDECSWCLSVVATLPGRARLRIRRTSSSVGD